jgi:hypothetical protein
MYLQNVISRNKYFFIGILKVKDENSRIRIYLSEERIPDPDPYQNVTDPQHCLQRAGRGCIF